MAMPSWRRSVNCRVMCCVPRKARSIRRCIGWKRQGGLRAKWITKDTGRRARIYELTAAGKKQLASRGVSLAGSHFSSQSRFEDGVKCHYGRASRMCFERIRLNREIEEEFEAHIAEAVEQGRDPEEARRALGAAVRQRQQSHDVRVVGWLDSLRADVVFGWRQLNRNKVTSAAAILSLALGHWSLHRGIPADRCVCCCAPYRWRIQSGFMFYRAKGWVLTTSPASGIPGLIRAFQLMRAAAKGQAELIALSYADRSDVTYKTDEEMEKANLQYVSGGMFSTFGIKPALGRLLNENDDRKPGAAPFAVLSYDYWSRRFGRDPHVIGRTLHIGDGVYEIIGVSEEEVHGDGAEARSSTSSSR